MATLFMNPTHSGLSTQERLLYIQRRLVALNPDIPGWESGSYNYPIRLADVLPAMEAARCYIGVMDDGHLVHLSADLNARRYVVLPAQWDIESDDLQSQSDDTIRTLYHLLTNETRATATGLLSLQAAVAASAI
jgi:hypothetical protein